jgi:hypothetical protein
MPSQSIDSAFIKLYFLDGAPWKWSHWQELCGTQHGLFPEDDSKLPAGWSRENANDILSYFRAFQKVDGEESRIRFVIESKHPGCALWKEWIKKQWAVWGLHSHIVAELREAEIHPHAILLRENDPSFTWPTANDYIASIIDSLGLKLFGEEAFPDDADILCSDYRNCLKVLIIKSWTDIRYQINGFKRRATRLEALVQSSFQGA